MFCTCMRKLRSLCHRKESQNLSRNAQPQGALRALHEEYQRQEGQECTSAMHALYVWCTMPCQPPYLAYRILCCCLEGTLASSAFGGSAGFLTVATEPFPSFLDQIGKFLSRVRTTCVKRLGLEPFGVRDCGSSFLTKQHFLLTFWTHSLSS